MAAGDLDDERDDTPYRAPLPKDDRLWRHPSELEEAPPHSGGLPYRHRATDPVTRTN